jgi:tetratricopeptide (TPR) repeat protein
MLPTRSLGALALASLTGCAGELTALAALTFSMTLGAWIVGRGRSRHQLWEAHYMRHAIATGQHRTLETGFRNELALAAAGEAVSAERQILARALLGGLLVAEWRLDEAEQLYRSPGPDATPRLRAVTTFGLHELSVLGETPDEARLQAIRADRDTTLAHYPELEGDHMWNALEGLCLVRMGRAREAVPLLERGLNALQLSPARVVYLFHLGQAYEAVGERKLANETYEQAMGAFPGTRLASEARSRMYALGTGGNEEPFRGMLPEAPGQTELPRALPEPADEDA